MKKRYEAPKIQRNGDLRDLTQGQGILGDDDSFTYHGYTVHYGTS